MRGACCGTLRTVLVSLARQRTHVADARQARLSARVAGWSKVHCSPPAGAPHQTTTKPSSVNGPAEDMLLGAANVAIMAQLRLLFGPLRHLDSLARAPRTGTSNSSFEAKTTVTGRRRGLCMSGRTLLLLFHSRYSRKGQCYPVSLRPRATALDCVMYVLYQEMVRIAEQRHLSWPLFDLAARDCARDTGT